MCDVYFVVPSNQTVERLFYFFDPCCVTLNASKRRHCKSRMLVWSTGKLLTSWLLLAITWVLQTDRRGNSTGLGLVWVVGPLRRIGPAADEIPNHCNEIPPISVDILRESPDRLMTTEPTALVPGQGELVWTRKPRFPVEGTEANYWVDGQSRKVPDHPLSLEKGTDGIRNAREPIGHGMCLLQTGRTYKQERESHKVVK